MTILELLQHGVVPFEISDTKLESLFSFFCIPHQRLRAEQH